MEKRILRNSLLTSVFTNKFLLVSIFDFVCYYISSSVTLCVLYIKTISVRQNLKSKDNFTEISNSTLEHIPAVAHFTDMNHFITQISGIRGNMPLKEMRQ